MGNFHLPDPTTSAFGVLDSDQAFSVSFSHTAALPLHQHAFIQCAVLHTTVDGRRRVRVTNLALQVAEIAADVFRSADMDVVVGYFMRQCKSIFAILGHLFDLVHVHQL
jgi:protein transport protein SEC24